MALKANVFTDDLRDLHETLADYGHYQLFVRWQFDHASKGVARSMEVMDKQGYDQNTYFTAGGQVLFNVFHDGQLDIRAPHGKRITQGQDLFRMSTEMEGRHNAFILVALYEALERFLRVTFGKLHFQIRNEMPIKDKKEFHKKKPEAKKIEGQPDYFHLYAEYACAREVTRAMDAFENYLETGRFIRTAQSWPKLTWREFFGAFAICRHLIVHNYGRVSTTSLRKLNVVQKELVETYIHESLLGKERTILPSTAMIDRIFEIIGSYGWGLYILLTDRCAMVDETEFFRPHDGGKRKVLPK